MRSPRRSEIAGLGPAHESVGRIEWKAAALGRKFKGYDCGFGDSDWLRAVPVQVERGFRGVKQQLTISPVFVYPRYRGKSEGISLFTFVA